MTVSNNSISGCADKEAFKTENRLPYAEYVVESNLKGQLRDPFVLPYNGKYYIYGTNWTVYETDDFRNIDEGKFCVVKPDDFVKIMWAPEVYYYKEKFYMITTYFSNKTNRKGCAIFVSDTPEGPFKLHSDGHITPKDWDAIDGTMYIDEKGQPWMVFVHEWVSTDDNIGRMAAAKMSDDLTEFISEPIELFRADDPKWSNGYYVTDGCYMYRCKGGALLMIWSNFDEQGYCVGIAVSENGSMEGPWVQQEERLYSKEMVHNYDGGHGMLFNDFNGNMWLAIHSPNYLAGDRGSIPIYIPVKEENNTLVWDTAKREIDKTEA